MTMISYPVLPDNPTVGELQENLNEICKLRGWDKNSLTEVFLLFSEEVGELAKAIRLETCLKGEEAPDDKNHLASEFADVFNYLLELASRFNIDLEKAYRDKNKFNEGRNWV